VTVGRRFVLVLLLYITLDLSMASMPGAFVFEADASIESVQMNRVRPLAEVTTASVPARDRETRVAEVEVKPLPRSVPRMPIRRTHGSRAPAPEPSEASEDSH
jgi:hypothetical protein